MALPSSLHSITYSWFPYHFLKEPPLLYLNHFLLSAVSVEKVVLQTSTSDQNLKNLSLLAVEIPRLNPPFDSSSGKRVKQSRTALGTENRIGLPGIFAKSAVEALCLQLQAGFRIASRALIGWMSSP